MIKKMEKITFSNFLITFTNFMLENIVIGLVDVSSWDDRELLMFC